METLSLNGNLEQEIIIKKICEQSLKDSRGRRRAFRITRDEINKAVRGNYFLNI